MTSFRMPKTRRGSKCLHAPFSSDRVCYGKLIKDLENNFIQGVDNYPPTLQQAYTLLVHWKQDPRNMVRLMGGVNNSIAFTNVGGNGAPQEEAPLLEEEGDSTEAKLGAITVADGAHCSRMPTWEQRW
jgi:hypothetical protein